MQLKQDSRNHSTTAPTCRQTVEAFLAPHHRLAADGYEEPVATCRQTVEAFLTPHHRLAADGYEEPVATCPGLSHASERVR